MVEHTPTPWRVISGDDYYIAADGYPREFIGRFKGDDMGDYLAFVGNRPKDFGEANAAFIVKAVNNYDALVEALTAVRAEINLSKSPKLAAKIDGVLGAVGGRQDG